jgi:hypothetical protein
MTGIDRPSEAPAHRRRCSGRGDRVEAFVRLVHELSRDARPSARAEAGVPFRDLPLRGFAVAGRARLRAAVEGISLVFPTRKACLVTDLEGEPREPEWEAELEVVRVDLDGRRGCRA